MTKFNVHASDIMAKEIFKEKKKLNPKIIRVGDIIKITNPEIIIRIGYPMSIYDAMEKVKEFYHNKIVEFLNKTIYNRTPLFPDIIVNGHNSRPYNKIISALAYEYLKSEQFGGKERKIFSKYRQELVGITSKVRKVFIRKTGIYFPPSGSHNYWTNEYEQESGGLDKEKTHKILELEIFSDYPNYVQIETCNVEKIYEEEL